MILRLVVRVRNRRPLRSSPFLSFDAPPSSCGPSQIHHPLPLPLPPGRARPTRPARTRPSSPISPRSRPRHTHSTLPPHVRALILTLASECPPPTPHPTPPPPGGRSGQDRRCSQGHVHAPRPPRPPPTQEGACGE
jgi:hypothetical protein